MMDNKSSCSIPSAAAIIGGNDDLLMEILLLLPAKSLIRFKLVSKQWRSLISAASFSIRHLLHHRHHHEPRNSFILGAIGITSQFFICNPTNNRLSPFSFGFPFVKILQSCNGLLLVECRKSPHGPKDYCVYNPTTMQYRNLYLSEVSLGLCLMFDPSKSHHYRVVHFMNDQRIIVYDSRTHTWNNGGESNHDQDSCIYCDGVCRTNRIHLICPLETRYCFLIKDKFCSIPHSPTTKDTLGRYIMESKGHLHYLWLSMVWHKLIYLDVFEMIDDKWLISRRADSTPLSATFAGDSSTKIDLIGMIREASIEDSMLLFHVPGKIMIYRFSDETSEVLVDFRKDCFYQEGRLQFRFRDAHPFIECLAPV